MAVPKKRISSHRRDRRRSHHHLRPVKPVICPHCKQPVIAHRICKSCGYYGGVQVMQPKE